MSEIAENENCNNCEGPSFMKYFKIHKDTISQIIFNPNK